MLIFLRGNMEAKSGPGLQSAWFTTDHEEDKDGQGFQYNKYFILAEYLQAFTAVSL